MGISMFVVAEDVEEVVAVKVVELVVEFVDGGEEEWVEEIKLSPPAVPSSVSSVSNKTDRIVRLPIDGVL